MSTDKFWKNRLLSKFMSGVLMGTFFRPTRSAKNSLVKSTHQSFERSLIFLIRLYQKHISNCNLPTCRFVPVCSEYAICAITKYRFVKGVYMSICRILRCNRFCKYGYDPVK